MEDQEVFKRYLTSDSKLKQYPSKKPLRMMALAWMASFFEMNRMYTEKEVNEILKSRLAFSDHELLRRELYTYHFMDRKKDGSQYWLEVQP